MKNLWVWGVLVLVVAAVLFGGLILYPFPDKTWEVRPGQEQAKSDRWGTLEPKESEHRLRYEQTFTY